MLKQHEQPEDPLKLQEEKDGYFTKQANSEFKLIVERERRNQRIGKLAFLRSIGRKGRLELSAKYGRRWQEAL